MKKGVFYSRVRCYDNGEPKDYRLKRVGYLVSASDFNFGIFKGEDGFFDIIDLKCGLSVNCLGLFKLKDIVANIEKYIERMTSYIKDNNIKYDDLAKIFEELPIKEDTKSE